MIASIDTHINALRMLQDSLKDGSQIYQSPVSIELIHGLSADRAVELCSSPVSSIGSLVMMSLMESNPDFLLKPVNESINSLMYLIFAYNIKPKNIIGEAGGSDDIESPSPVRFVFEDDSNLDVFPNDSGYGTMLSIM